MEPHGAAASPLALCTLHCPPSLPASSPVHPATNHIPSTPHIWPHGPPALSCHSRCDPVHHDPCCSIPRRQQLLGMGGWGKGSSLAQLLTPSGMQHVALPTSPLLPPSPLPPSLCQLLSGPRSGSRGGAQQRGRRRGAATGNPIFPFLLPSPSSSPLPCHLPLPLPASCCWGGGSTAAPSPLLSVMLQALTANWRVPSCWRMRSWLGAVTDRQGDYGFYYIRMINSIVDMDR